MEPLTRQSKQEMTVQTEALIMGMKAYNGSLAYTISGRECMKWSDSKILQEDIKREKEGRS